MIRTVLGDIAAPTQSVVYAHEHFIIDSQHISDAFPHIHLHDVDAAVEELAACYRAGVRLAIDAMPCASGRDASRLAEIAERSKVDIVAATGLHHDRYYGPQHWSNRVPIDTLTELFIADLTDGIDAFDYTGPIVERTKFRAGIVKVATSGANLDDRDRRNLAAAGAAAAHTGAPVLTHCEGGAGGLEQVTALVAHGVPASAVILSHIDKSHDLSYLRDLADTGVILEFDQALREHASGADSFTVIAIVDLVDRGHADQIVVGTDGARRSLWASLGGTPGLAWLAESLPALLEQRGLDASVREAILGGNAARALMWRAVA